jgi:tetratricopeptide (TPR) repeat protein
MNHEGHEGSRRLLCLAYRLCWLVSFVVFLAFTVSVCIGQDNSSPQQPASKPQGESSSQAHHSRHHVQVEDEEEAQPKALTNAETAIDRQDYASAESQLRGFLDHDPNNYVAWFDLGFVDNALGKLDESIAAYRKSVTAKPDVFESNLNLGLQLAKTGSPEAEQFLRAATQLKPTAHGDIEEGQYRAWLSLAQVIAKANPEEALADFRVAASLEPHEAEPHLSAGILLESENKFADAEQEYKQALALDPKSSDALTGLANIYMRGQKFPEAEDYLRKLLVSNPESAAAHIQLARVLAAEGKNDAAIPEMEAGIKLAPGDETPLRELANLYGTAGKNDLAEGIHRKLLIVHPNDAELHRALGQDFLRQKKFPEAQQEFAIAIKLKPDSGEGYGDLAFAAGENKNYALVVKALDARAKFLPDVAITYFMRASAYDHLKDFKNAAANYRLFLKAANGKYPDQEWQAQHRLIAIEPKK